MDAIDWIILIAALAALILAAYAAIGIRLLRKRQYRQILLDDITEWATDLLLCTSILDEMYIARKLGEKSRAASLASKWSAEVDLLRTRMENIEEAGSFLERNLGERVSKVRESLDKYRGLASDEIDGKIGDEKVIKELAVLNLSVRRLLQEISRTRKRR